MIGWVPEQKEDVLTYTSFLRKFFRLENYPLSEHPEYRLCKKIIDDLEWAFPRLLNTTDMIRGTISGTDSILCFIRFNKEDNRRATLQVDKFGCCIYNFFAEDGECLYSGCFYDGTPNESFMDKMKSFYKA